MPKYAHTPTLLVLNEKARKRGMDHLPADILKSLDKEGFHVVFTSSQEEGYVEVDWMLKLSDSPFPEFYTMDISNKDYDSLLTEEV